MNETAVELDWFEELKPALTSYCYRMLGSVADADDAFQETCIRAWQSWDTFNRQSSRKTWLYRIATNVCIDKLRQAKRRALPVDLFDPAETIVAPRETLPESAWIWPAPERVADDPEQALLRKDSLRLCFIALLQALPPRQRAVLLLKDVFAWSSLQIAETLDMTPAAVNSALQRARQTMKQTDLHSAELCPMDSAPDHALLARYVEAFERFDIPALVALFHEEGCLSMPPFAMWVRGKDHLTQFFTLTRFHCEGSRFLPVQVNGGYPAFAQYMPSDDDPSVLVPWGIHVIETRNERILHTQNFISTALFAQFGLPDNIHR